MSELEQQLADARQFAEKLAMTGGEAGRVAGGALSAGIPSAIVGAGLGAAGAGVKNLFTRKPENKANYGSWMAGGALGAGGLGALQGGAAGHAVNIALRKVPALRHLPAAVSAMRAGAVKSQ